MMIELFGRAKTLSKSITRKPYDALDLLRADHMKAELMLVRLRLMRDSERRKNLFKQIRPMLEKHMRIEEELFYPACAQIPKLRHLLDHAKSEHEHMKNLLKDLAIIKAETRRYDQLITTFITKIEEHVIDEENKVFDGVRKYMNKTQFAHLSRAMLNAYSEGEKPAREAA